MNAALFDSTFKFFGLFADNNVKQARFCGVRIESISLDVNDKENIGS